MTRVAGRHDKATSRFPMACTTEHDFAACVEDLIIKLASRRGADAELERRVHDVLIEGYGRALALEGRRRRLRERQLELADLPKLDAAGLRELAALARREAGLVRKEHELRALLAPLGADARCQGA
jgi:hypothetical protein